METACVCAKLLQLCLDFVTLWTVACQALQSMGFSRQEYWSGLPCPPPGDLPNPGIKSTVPAAPALQADSLLLGSQPPGKPKNYLFINRFSIVNSTLYLYSVEKIWKKKKTKKNTQWLLYVEKYIKITSPKLIFRTPSSVSNISIIIQADW